MRFFDWFRRPAAAPSPEPEPVPEPGVAPAAVTMTAQPLVVGNGQDPVEYAKYRLDAIARHIGQHDVPPEKMQEFRQETFSLMAALHKFAAVLAHEEDAALKIVGIR